MMREPVPEWAQQLLTHFSELELLLFDIPILRDKTITNYNEIENIHRTISIIKENTKLVPRILEIAIENYVKCDELSDKVKILENSMFNLHSMYVTS